MTRFRAAIVAVVLALASTVGSAVPVAAQSDLGEIDITVIDASTQKPLANARTVLLGPQTASSLTTAAGAIHYIDVPIGIYRIRVQRQGYDPGVTREFDVLPDRAVEIRIELAKRAPRTGSPGPLPSPGPDSSGLKTIAVVAARAHIEINSVDIAENSPMRRLSDSLTDALDKLAGVTVTSDATDPSSAITISLHNQDESQTALTLDGIPLSAPGVAGNLRGIGSDLFSGSRVSFSPQAGSLGGSVNFRTLEPTQAFQARTSGTTGTFDRSNYSLAATGSLGSLGLALQHTWRGANSPLTFQDYEDQSGLTYPHEGESTQLGDFVKFRYRVNDDRTTITGTALSNNRDASAICARDVTTLPCGIGPDNRSFGRYGFAYTTIQSLVGNIQTTLSGYTNASNQTTDYVNRFVLDPTNNYQPTLDPSLADNVSTTRGIVASAAIAQGNHTFTLSGTTYSALSTSTPLAGSQFEVPFTNAASSTSYKFADNIKSNDRLTITPQVSLADTTGLGASFLGGVALSWQPQPANAFSFSLNVGSSQPNLNANRSYSDPNAARFDCGAQTAIVSGPGDTGSGTRQSATVLNLGWSHQFNGGALVTVSAFSQVQSGQIISALIQEPASFYPAGYLPILFQAYRAPTVCGVSAAAPTVYAQESVAGTRRVYQGFDLSGRFALSKYVQILPTYSLNLATLTAASARLQDGPSTSIVGMQLPGRPIHRAGVTLDGLLPRSGIEMLANAQFTGANNNQNLGPYVNVSFGVSHKFGPGQITLFENNAFGTYAGDFASDTFAAPRVLSNGLPFMTAATPLTPRTIFLSYSAAIGGPAPGPAFNSLGRGARVAAAPQPTPSGRPRQQRLTSYPPPAGVDPLSLARDRPGCTADLQTAGQPVLAALQAYVTAYESGATPPPIPNVNVTAHKAADATLGYFLELRANLPRPPGAQGNGDGQGARVPRARGAGGGGAGGLGGGGGFPGMEGAPTGGEPGAQPGGAPPAGGNGQGAQSADNAAARSAFQAYANLPEVRAYRGFTGCTYVTLLLASDAKVKGIVTENGRPGIFYVPKIGLVFVQALQLPQGGGSLKQGK
jgi:hypothetical protein